MKRFLLLMIVLLTTNHMIGMVKDDDTLLKYEIKSAGRPQQGFYIVEVSAYVEKKKDIGLDIVKKCAIHGVLFKGFSGDLQKDYKQQKPMLKPTAEYEHQDFFTAFFQSDYLAYASSVGTNLQTVKSGKGFEVTAVIQVSKDQLRQTMESAGIIRKLGF